MKSTIPEQYIKQSLLENVAIIPAPNSGNPRLFSQIEDLGEYPIPAYATTALLYSDYSGISENDEQNINEWLVREFPEHHCLVFSFGEGESEFNPYPAFGLPADCLSCRISGHRKGE